jgi:hypothetical protein
MELVQGQVPWPWKNPILIFEADLNERGTETQRLKRKEKDKKKKKKSESCFACGVGENISTENK